MLDSRETRAIRLVLDTATQPQWAPGRTDTDSAPIRDDPADRQARTEELAGVLAQCSAALAESFPYDDVEKWLNKNRDSAAQTRDASDSEPTEEGLSSALSQWIDDNMDLWESALVAALLAAAMAGFYAAFDELMAQFDLKRNAVPEMTAQLERWANEQAGKLLARLKSDLMALVRSFIEELLEKKLSSEEILERVKARLKSILTNKEELDTVAKDEESEAWNEGAASAHKLLGATAKRWFTRLDGRVCPICVTNEDDGEIPIGQPFASGHPYPPAHPRCRCMMAWYGETRESILQALLSWLFG